MASDERQEAVDAILEEMRYAPIPKHDRDIELLRMFADRIEAAWKREQAEIEVNALAVGGVVEAERHTPGNAAAMREALNRILEFPTIHESSHRDKWTLRLWLEACRKNARDALSAPARNCDKFADAESARQAWLDDAENWDEFGSPKLELHEWLIAPAAERKGEGDGR